MRWSTGSIPGTQPAAIKCSQSRMLKGLLRVYRHKVTLYRQAAMPGPVPDAPFGTFPAIATVARACQPAARSSASFDTRQASAIRPGPRRHRW
jgi:hypothetical protein